MKIARFIFQLFGINTYVVWDPESKDCAVIDPGMISPEEEDALDKFITKNSLKVKHLINTHLHIDHAAGNKFVTERYGIGSEANSNDQFLSKSFSQQSQMFNLPFDAEGVEITNDLQDGDIVKIGNGELKVLQVPGHSPGSIALYDSKDKFLISGDALFEGSIGRTDLPGGSSKELIESIKIKILSLPDDTVVYPGHGDPTTVGSERKYNPFLRN